MKVELVRHGQAETEALSISLSCEVMNNVFQGLGQK